jgi:hypothetical protein
VALFAGMARSYRSSALHTDTLAGAGHARKKEMVRFLRLAAI